MLREIYNKDPEDPNYKEDQLEVTDPLEVCVGKIKMMIFTKRGEVLGDPSFGLDLESLIYDMNLSESALRKEVQNNIRAYIPEFEALGGTYELKFYLGTNRDIATLDFRFNSNSGLSPIVTLLIT
jgi:hypothetical protein